MIQSLNEAIVQFNANRIYVSAKIMLIISGVLAVANIVGTVLHAREEPYYKGYLVVYGLLVLLNVGCLYYFRRYHYCECTKKRYKCLVNMYIYGMILCGMWISYIDIQLYSHYIMFLIIYFLCCTLFVMEIRYFVFISVISFSVVMFQIKSTLVGDIIFMVTILLIGLIVQHFVSQAQQRVIVQERLLKESVEKSEHLTSTLREANEALTKQAMYDQLTAIPNRNGFYAYARTFINGDGQPVSLLMMDIDYFKQYNDFYNHVQGDAVLYDVAQMIQRAVTKHDGYVARWGGEEFLVMTTPAHAEAICEDIQQALAKAAIVHERSAINAYVTMSIGGFSGMMISVDELDDFYKRADVMLYEVKQHGRNHFRIREELAANT